MRFGHYTVFDTPEENKHTQVYVEYDVPNKDNLDGATGAIFLTEGGEGSGEGIKHGIESVTILPAGSDINPPMSEIFPIYWEDLTPEQQESMREDPMVINVGRGNIDPSEDYTVVIQPTANMCVWNEDAGDYGEMGEPVTQPIHGSEITIGAADSPTDPTYMLSVGIIWND